MMKRHEALRDSSHAGKTNDSTEKSFSRIKRNEVKIIVDRGTYFSGSRTVKPATIKRNLCQCTPEV